MRLRSRLYAIEQRPHRDPEDLGDADQPAATDAIGAVLLLLNPLECDADPLSESRPRQASR